jgi:isoquinoline 1-oxidoreductase alpha subunit
MRPTYNTTEEKGDDMAIELDVNGEKRTIQSDPDTPLLWVLRDELRLTGTKFGCGVAQCGACTVHVDGLTKRACVTPVKAVAGRKVTTIEGLSGEVATAVQGAWTELDVPQCGYCQSGQVMSAVALLAEVPKPTDEQIDRAMGGNICRCATYVRIRGAIHKAAGGEG